jgi:hypothetical protein
VHCSARFYSGLGSLRSRFQELFLAAASNAANGETIRISLGKDGPILACGSVAGLFFATTVIGCDYALMKLRM